MVRSAILFRVSLCLIRPTAVDQLSIVTAPIARLLFLFSSFGVSVYPPFGLQLVKEPTPPLDAILFFSRMSIHQLQSDVENKKINKFYDPHHMVIRSTNVTVR